MLARAYFTNWRRGVPSDSCHEKASWSSDAPLEALVSDLYFWCFSIPFHMARLLRAEYEGTLALDYSYFERHWTTISAGVERDGEKRTPKIKISYLG